MKEYNLNDIVQMKKPHPCEGKPNSFIIIRLGMDIRIKCTECGRSVLIPRSEFDKKLVKILKKHEGNE